MELKDLDLKQENLISLRQDMKNYLGERAKLIEGLTQAFRDGVPAKEVARLVAPAFSRDQVTQYLAAVAISDSALKALTEAGLAAKVSASFTGINPPREARLQLAVDPSQAADFVSLPEQARAALRDFHLTFAPVHNALYDEDADLDDVLRDGEEVRLVKAQPRA